MTKEEKELLEDYFYKKIDLEKEEIKILKNEVASLYKTLNKLREIYLSERKKVYNYLVGGNNGTTHYLLNQIYTKQGRIAHLEKKNQLDNQKYKKEYETLVPVLSEDIELLKQELSEELKNIEETLNNFNKIEREYDYYRKLLKEKKLRLRRLTLQQEKNLSDIRLVDKLYKKNKKAPQRLLKLINL